MTSAEVLAGPGEGHTPIILLAEDNVLVRFTTAEMLREAGYTVLEAVDASEALALIATGHPLDLVLSDVRMPGRWMASLSLMRSRNCDRTCPSC